MNFVTEFNNIKIILEDRIVHNCETTMLQDNPTNPKTIPQTKGQPHSTYKQYYQQNHCTLHQLSQITIMLSNTTIKTPKTKTMISPQ
jgi:hypothetical protein